MMTQPPSDFTARGRRLTGRQVLAAMVAFFLVVVAVNGVMITLALRSSPGLVSATPYRDGLEWNRRLEDAARQAELGWAAGLDLVSGRRLVARIDDGRGLPLAGLAVTIRLKRPSDARLDRDLAVTADRPGRYVAALGGVAPGRWDAELEATAPNGGRIRLIQPINIR